MLNLPQISIVSVNCIDAIESVKAINYSRRNIDFGHAYLFTHEDIKAEGVEVIKIPRLLSVDQYNDFVLRLADYNMEGEYFLIVQDDGYPINSACWMAEFQDFDFLGAPWPNDPTWVEKQKLKYYKNFVGNGGFSLRSKKFLQLSSVFTTCHGFGEDVYLCSVQYDYMIANGIKFAPVELAEKFSRENNLEDWTNPGRHNPKSSFGFHGKNFENHLELINLKNG